jgi:hypothetical protein
LGIKDRYNACVYTSRQSFFYGHGVPSWAKLDAMFRDNPLYKAMPAKVSQLVTKQVSDAWRVTSKLCLLTEKVAASLQVVPKYQDIKILRRGETGEIQQPSLLEKVA